jgi:hypothetical protein
MAIKETMMEILEKAKHNLSTYDNLLPVIIFIKDDVPCGIVPVQADTKRQMYGSYYAAGKICRKAALDGMLLVNDVALRFSYDKEEQEYIKQNLDTESPLTYPEGLVRQEAIMILHCSCTGKTTDLLQIYERKDGCVIYKDLLEETDGSRSGNIPELFQKGYQASP